MSNPLDPARKLILRLQAEAAKLGLDLHSTAVMPNINEGGPDVLQVMFIVTPKAIGDQSAVSTPGDVELTDEERALFAGLEESIAEVDSSQAPNPKAEAAKEDLAKWLKDKDE